MPKASKLFALSTLLLLAVAVPAMANQSSPVSGTFFYLEPGETATVKVTGTGGCVFVAFASSEDEMVATASSVDMLKKKQTVTITAAAVGTTDVQITTSSKTSSCNDFMFSFTVVVEPNLKDFIKQAKGKIKEYTGFAKQDLANANKLYCDQLADIAKNVKSGKTSVEEALDQAFGHYEFWASFYHLGFFEVEFEAYSDIWNRAKALGFTSLNKELVGFLEGGCGEWDKFEAKMSKLADKGVAQGLKKFKKLIKVLDKFAAGDDAELLVVIEDPAVLLAVNIPVPLPAAAPQVPPPAPPKVLQKSWTGSGSLTTAPDSGLIMGGSADPGAGDVTVTIKGPDGFEASMTVPVDKACEWKAKFTELPRGSYTVELSQGANDPVGFVTPVV